jgi:hypothetical protein
MSAFSEKRQEAHAELSTLNQRVRAQLAAAGQSAVESGTVPADEPFASLLAHDAEIVSRLRELRATRGRIASAGERLADIKTKTDRLDARRKEISSELEPHYQTIGENAFRVFHDNPLVDQEYADIFTPVLEAHEEIKLTRSEIERGEADLVEKPFLEKMVVRGRIIVLRNRLSLRESQITRLYREAGRQITATDFITTIGDPGLEAAAAPFLGLTDEWRRIDDELRAYEKERESLHRELMTLGVERRAAGRIAEIDEAINAAESTRKDSLTAIATAARESGRTDELGEEFKERLEAVAATEARRSEVEERVERLEAAIQVERMHAEIELIDSTIARKRSQIEKLTEDIAGLERDKESLAGMAVEAEARRGPVDDLYQ